MRGIRRVSVSVGGLWGLRRRGEIARGDGAAARELSVRASLRGGAQRKNGVSPRGFDSKKRSARAPAPADGSWAWCRTWSPSLEFVAKQLIVMFVMAVALAPIDASGQTASAADAAVPSAGAAQLTGKERLGEKWNDEQRIDNCKVPLDKRGTKPRPDSCVHAPTG